MRLTKPTLSMKEAFLDFTKEWESRQEEIIPAAARLEKRSYEEWLVWVQTMEEKPPAGYVPATSLFYLDAKDKLLGIIDIRHCLNDYLFKYGGHIGFGVRPSERQKHHATDMLKAAFPFIRSLGLQRVLITCNKLNVASARAIINNGGRLENEVEDGESIIQRYWIAL